MVSPEFKRSVSENNILRTRIMLKDSLVIDPSYTQFDEMLQYAKNRIPGLIVPFDNEYLENNNSMWTKELLNQELVQLVSNFSEHRIVHLKNVIRKVMGYGKARTVNQSNNPNVQKAYSAYVAQNNCCKPQNAYKSSNDNSIQSLIKTVNNESRKINNVLTGIQSRNKYKQSEINEIEQSAQSILKAIQDYKNNR